MPKYIQLSQILNDITNSNQNNNIYNITINDYNNKKENFNLIDILDKNNCKTIRFYDDNNYTSKQTLIINDINNVETIIIDIKTNLDLQLYDCKKLKNIIIHDNINVDIIYENCPLKTIKYYGNSNQLIYNYHHKTINNIDIIYELI